MLECISCYVYISQPKVIVVDRELALLKAIQRVFPESAIMVCVWHIQEKLLAKCKEARLNDEAKDDFMKSWNNIIEQPTEELFNARLRDLEDKYNGTAAGSEVITYLHDTWLPYKHYFSHPWTNKCTHFGELASSRSEGGHYTIKSWIKQSTSDLLVAVDHIKLALQQQHHDIHQKIAEE